MPKIGERYGSLVVVEKSKIKTDKNIPLFLCQCDCGKQVLIKAYRFHTGKIVHSCGCDDKRKTSDGKYKHPLYKIYVDMKNRCYYTKDISYSHYGMKGITVCNEWLNNFMSFYNWSVNNGWEKGLSLDRIDNNKGYSPENCRWTDIITQNNNKTNNRFLTINGETLTVAQWSRKINIKHSTILERLKRGYTEEDAVMKPIIKKNNTK